MPFDQVEIDVDRVEACHRISEIEWHRGAAGFAQYGVAAKKRLLVAEHLIEVPADPPVRLQDKLFDRYSGRGRNHIPKSRRIWVFVKLAIPVYSRIHHDDRDMLESALVNPIEKTAAPPIRR